MARLVMVPASTLSGTIPTLAPECMAVPLSEIGNAARRLDAEVYLTDGYAIRIAIKRSDIVVSMLADLAAIWQPSRLKGIRVNAQDGTPFLAATQVFDIWPTPRKWLAPTKTPDLRERYVEPGCILVTCSGTVGNVLIAYSAHSGVAVSHDLMRVQVDDVALRHYVYAFLRTLHGRAMMRGSHYGNIIKHLEVEHLSDLPVPLLPNLLDEVALAIEGVFRKRDEAYRLDMLARDRLSGPMQRTPASQSEIGFTVPARRLFQGRRRLDGYAHNPRALAIAEAVAIYGTSVVGLGDLARLVLPGRFARTYSAKGTPLLGSEDLFKINPEITKFLAPAMDLNLDDYTVSSGWLLMARSGQIYGINGSVILASARHEHQVITEDVIRIIPDTNKVRAGYLQAFLNHPTVGQPLVLRTAFGTSIPHIATEDLADVPIARLGSDIEDEIADVVDKASELRMEADNEENGIVAKLEAAIDEKIGRTRKLRPDVNETAYRVMLEATGQAPRTRSPKDRAEGERNAVAVARGKRGGRPKREAGGS